MGVAQEKAKGQTKTKTKTKPNLCMWQQMDLFYFSSISSTQQ